MELCRKSLRTKNLERQDAIPWTVELQGGRVVVRIVKSRRRPPPKKKNQIIKEFSRSSRLRLLKNIATIDWEQVPQAQFFTLTYHDDEVHYDRDRRNRERYLFVRHLEKHLGRKLSIIWRCEWVKRKSGKHRGRYLPHIHLLVLGCGYVCYSKCWGFWKDACQAKLRCRFDGQWIMGPQVAAFYVAKYCGKIERVDSLVNVPYLNRMGRSYGYMRPKGIPRHEQLNLDLGHGETRDWLQEQADNLLHWRIKGEVESFTLLGTQAMAVGKELLERLLTPLGDLQ